MASTMTSISLVLMSAVIANAVNLRSGTTLVGTLPPNLGTTMAPWYPGQDRSMGTAKDPLTWKYQAPLDESAACPKDWVRFMSSGNCYKLFTSKTVDARRPYTAGAVTVLSPATFDEAVRTCRDNNPSSHIAVPNTLAENNFLNSEIYNQSLYVSPTKQTGNNSDPWTRGADGTWLGFDWCGTGKKEDTFLSKCYPGQKKWGNGWSDGTNSSWRLLNNSDVVNTANADSAPAMILQTTGKWEFVDKSTVKRPFICEMSY